MVDKNLFLHDLAIVAIMKNEGHYLKEWLDYHLLAGVDHFYIYDNDSTDNQREVAAPYVKAGLVDYISAPGKIMQMFTYNDAPNRFKFQCRYMAFIDGDEFIFPTRGGGIVEVVDEVLSRDPNASGLAANIYNFGSNGHETADYSKGVLERFTRRAPSDWVHPRSADGSTPVSTITNPRMIDVIVNPHFAVYFEGRFAVNENGGIVSGPYNNPVTADKIVMNHYHAKSKEEYEIKIARGLADSLKKRAITEFDIRDRNEVFDDGILRYRDERAKTFRLPDKSRFAERLLSALVQNLSPTLLPTTPQKFYAGKMETFLTCREVAAYLKKKFADESSAKFFEEAALKAILKSAVTGMTFADAQLFIRELPNLLTLPYPAVKEIRAVAVQIISQLMHVFHLNNYWKNFVELNYILRLLQTWRPQ